MRKLLLVLLFLVSLFSIFSPSVWALDDATLNVRGWVVNNSGKGNDTLEQFVGPLLASFIRPGNGGGEGITDLVVVIAYNVKNFFIFIALVFLLVWVMKLLLSDASEEKVKVWRQNILWVSLGILLMQVAYTVWTTLILGDVTEVIGSGLGGKLWRNIFSPFVQVLQMLAAFGFIAMSILAFYTMVTGGGDEEKFKKWKNTLIYSIIWFILIRIPETLIRLVYGQPDCKNVGPFNLVTIGDCAIKDPNVQASLGIFGNFVNYLNGFLALLSVILIIYAGWLVLISAGDEEKLKKAKGTIIYIALGLILLVGSHAIFRFFILKG